MKESDLLSSVEKCSDSVVAKDLNFQNEQIEIEREVILNPNLTVIASKSVMANTKQTAQKANNGQGSPARFPSRGTPGRKATQHMMAVAEDGNSNDGNSSDSGSRSNNEQENSQVQNTIKAGKCRRVWGGKARVYKHPKGVVCKYRPGVGALREIWHYQREYGVICSKAAVARMVRELCEKKDMLASQSDHGFA